MKRRPNGAGTVTQRKDGQWEGRIRFRDDGHKLIIKSCFADTKEECEEKIVELRKQYGVIDKDEFYPEMPFKDWCQLWLRYEKAKVAHITIQCYAKQIKLYFDDRIGDIPINQITAETLGRLYSDLRRNGRTVFVEEKGEGVSLGTIRTLHRLARAIFKKAVLTGVIDVDPAKATKIPKTKNKELYIFTNEEIRSILELAKERGIYLSTLIALCTGLNRGELVGLRWNDINFKTGVLTVKRVFSCTDGEPEIAPLQRESLQRSIHLPKSLVKEIHTYKKQSNSLWIFPSFRNIDRPCNPNGITQNFKEILRELGLERATFSSLRDTFAVQALNHGIDVKTLSYVLGHSSVRGVVRAYVPLMDKHKREAARKIESAMLDLLSRELK